MEAFLGKKQFKAKAPAETPTAESHIFKHCFATLENIKFCGTHCHVARWLLHNNQ